MTFGERWLRRPQSLWLRKAIFQIHLWTGIALGIYVVLISVSGSAIVFRNELYKSLFPPPKIVAISGPRLSKDAIKKAVKQTWPRYSVSYIFEAKRADEATEVWIGKDSDAHPKTKGRLINPFTGEDLGPSRPISVDVVAWLMDLHINLLAGEKGREVNGVLAIVMVIISLSGLVIWWPGTGRVKRSLKIDFKANWKRLNWDLHSVIGAVDVCVRFDLGRYGRVCGVPETVPGGGQPLLAAGTLQAAIAGGRASRTSERNPRRRRITAATPAAPASATQKKPRRYLSALVLLSAFRQLRRLAREGALGGARSGAALPVRDRRIDVVESGAEPGSARVTQTRRPLSPAWHD